MNSMCFNSGRHLTFYMVLVYQGGKKKTFNKAMEWLQESVYPWAFHSFKGSDVIPVHNEIAVPAKEP